MVQIANGKVKAWLSNGVSQTIASSSVSKTKVSIEHAEGAKVNITPKGDGLASYSWSGNGKTSHVVLKRN
ncbi:hypothetical protein G3A39_44250 [Paraburkholderia aspalathi]|nr:hypothetical protein [Paraburkholderia aspalathi]